MKQRTCELIGYFQDPEKIDPKTLKKCIIIRPDDYWLEIVQHFIENNMQHLLTVTCKFGKWYKRRSTGERSQNHRINGFLQQIIVGYGLDYTIDELKWYFKHLAIGRGYPFKTMPDGTVIPKSETKLTTIEAAILSDTIEEWCAKRAFKLKQYGEDGSVIYV